MAKGFRKAQPHEIAEVINLLRDVIEPGHAPGMVRYKGDWSDEAVAKLAGCPVTSVATLRLRYHGRTKAAPQAAADDATSRNHDERIRWLEEELVKACSRHDELRDSHTNLAELVRSQREVIDAAVKKIGELNTVLTRVVEVLSNAPVVQVPEKDLRRAGLDNRTILHRR